MKIPTDIKTKHKIRDSKICSLYATEGYSFQTIATRFNISATRVGQIIYKNRDLLKANKIYEKIKRINHLKRLLNLHPEKLGNKDTVDLLEALRSETEGSKAEGGAGERTIIIIRSSEKKEADDRTEVSPQLISRSISL